MLRMLAWCALAVAVAAAGLAATLIWLVLTDPLGLAQAAGRSFIAR